MNVAVDSIDRPVSPIYIDSVLEITGGKLHVVSRWLNSCVVLLTDSTAILGLQGKPFVVNAEAVGYFSTGLHRPASNGKDKFAIERNTSPVLSKARTTGTPGTYGSAYTQTTMVDGDYLHDHGLRGSGKLIAVIDEGFQGVDVHHGFDSLRMSGRLLETYNYTLDTSYVFDYSDHGTAALSTMAGIIDSTSFGGGVSYLGSAPGSMYALYISEYKPAELPVEMDQLVAALERADSIGADVVSVSLGYNTFDAPFESYSIAPSAMDGVSSVVARGVNIATSRGLLFVGTSGNEGAGGLLTPGDADSALTIGAVTPGRTPASFSSYGPNAAGRIKPDVSAMGSPAYVLYGTGTFAGAANGTSFAGPQIAGWAACLLQGAPQGTKPAVIRDAINRSADHYTSPGPQIGYGIPDFKIAGAISEAVDTTPMPQGNSFVSVWPTVFNNELNVKINAGASENVQCRILDISGRTFWHTDFNTAKGTQWFPLSVPAALPAGMYFFEAVGSAGEKQVVKILKY
ncbi:S8 family peptidase [Chitinophagaceae bacterium MMS25-I14]